MLDIGQYNRYLSVLLQKGIFTFYVEDSWEIIFLTQGVCNTVKLVIISHVAWKHHKMGQSVALMGFSTNFNVHLFSVPYVTSCQTGARFNTIYKGCEIQCEECTIEGKEPVCLEMMEHSNAAGGNATVESLSIDRGYWRATNTSVNIFPCYNPGACVGGVTGAEDYCHVGYRGPCKSGTTLDRLVCFEGKDGYSI